MCIVIPSFSTPIFTDTIVRLCVGVLESGSVHRMAPHIPCLSVSPVYLANTLGEGSNKIDSESTIFVLS